MTLKHKFIVAVCAVLMLSVVPALAQSQTYTVRGGDTLASISARFNVGLESLLVANNITNPNTVFAGQVLVIPQAGTVGTGGPLSNPPPVIDVTTPTPSPTPQLATYVVQPGDSLTRIATIFNTTVADLVSVNSLASPNSIRRGQVLFLPPGVNIGGPVTQPSAPSVTATPLPRQPAPAGPRQAVLRQYVVQSGDVLSVLADEFGTTVEVIVALNDLDNPARLFPGDVLLLP